MKRHICLYAFIILLVGGFAVEARADRVIRVNFGSGVLTLSDLRSEEALMSTRVVLPKGDYYPVPVTGTVTKAEMGPTWVPTANMHRDFPGKYKRVYGPYEPGNAMGHCKISIAFDQAHPLLPYVRIHGNAEEEDLGKRRSRSCIRIPDALCPTIVELIGDYEVHVEFVK